MKKNILGLIASVKKATGVNAALFSPSGEKESDADFLATCTVPPRGNEIVQPDDAPYTFFRVRDGYIVALDGTGETYRNYAVLFRAAIEAGSVATPPLTLADRMRAYLTDELDEEGKSELATHFHDPFDCYVLTLVADSPKGVAQLQNYLDAMREQGDWVVPYGETAVAFIKSCGGDDDYRSANDFANTLYDSIMEELRVKIVINVGGTVHSFGELKTVFHRCLFAYNFGKLMAPNAPIYSYKEYVMIKMLSEIPDESLASYLGAILDRDGRQILDDPELMETAEQFLKNSLNISETSRSMYMHRNTLIYRLDKIENATGLNLRHFNDAVVFHLLTMLKKLTDKRPQ
ncbi:MAG: helix-turn-helix domain-containing protein [Clostridiales bacterium]|nr:helix-turn-helix domain-containing protein [Clostridiales bacterium]